MTNYSPDPNSKRPLPLQKTVRRMVETLANASLEANASEGDQPSNMDSQEFSPEVIRGIIRARQARVGFLPEDLLSDPAWGMLLELLSGELEGKRVSMATLREASAVPDSTAARWVKALEGHDLIVRRQNPDGAGSEFAELTSKGSAALHAYFRYILGNG